MLTFSRSILMKQLLLVLVSSAALLSLDFGAQMLTTNDEARFPLLARDVLEHGHWMMPSLIGELHVYKPPLYAWLIVLATICDLVENIAVSQMLRGPVSQWNVSLAYNLARIKFSIVIVCLLFMLVCSLYWTIGKLGAER